MSHKSTNPKRSKPPGGADLLALFFMDPAQNATID